MKNFTNPLDNIRVASPCSQDWDTMHGDNRKRFCGECKLNVYNLSGMTRNEAESLLINAEGRLCVRFYRRSDGSILTQDCPVGWQAAKRRVSKTATAVFASIVGLFSGIFSVGFFKASETPTRIMGAFVSEESNVSTMGTPTPPAIMGNIAVKTQNQDELMSDEKDFPKETIGKLSLPKNKKRGQ